MLDFLKLRNFLSLDPVFPKTKSICYWFQTMKNDWVWKKIFERFITILNVLFGIIGLFFFNYYQLLRSVTLSLKVFHWIIKCTLQHFNMMVDLFILNYPLEYAKRLLTLFQSKLQCRHIGWLKNRALQIHCNLTPLLGTNKLVSKAWKKRDHRGLQKVYVIWYSFCVLDESFARTFVYKQLLFLRSWSSWPINVQCHIFIPPENIRKHMFFWRFQGV